MNTDVHIFLVAFKILVEKTLAQLPYQYDISWFLNIKLLTVFTAIKGHTLSKKNIL